MDNNTITAYCLKCKEKKQLNNPTLKTSKRGSKFISGKCDCGTSMSKFIKSDSKIDVTNKKEDD